MSSIKHELQAWKLQMLVILVCSHLAMDYSYSIDGTSDSVNAFLELLNLTDIEFARFRWCTFAKTEDNSGKYKSTKAIACSCAQDCVIEKNCCPDVKLTQYLNGSVYSNITQLVSAISEIDGIGTLDMTVKYNTFEQTSQMPTVCLPSDFNHYYVNAPRSSMYLMVAACINQTVNTEDREKCENQRLGPETHIDDFRPVQSLDTGVVYRNKYCFQCSIEVNSTHAKWDVFLADTQYPREDLLNCHLSYADMVSSLIQGTYKYGDISSSHIIFEPTDELRLTHRPTPCHHIDVASCAAGYSETNLIGNSRTNISGNSETNLTEINEPSRSVNTNSRLRTQQACMLYSLPIYTSRARKMTVFKNIACIYCKDDISHRSFRSSSQGDIAFLGKLSNKLLSSMGHENTSANWELGEPIKAIPSSMCEEGFIYDHDQKTCRQLYCPCGMITYNFTCTPMYSNICDTTFTLFVTLKQQADFKNVDNYTKFETTLIEYFGNDVDDDDDIQLDDLVLYKRKHGTKGSLYVMHFFLSIRCDRVDYFSFIRKINHLANGSKKIKEGKITTHISLDLVDSMELFHYRLYDRLAKTVYQGINSRTDKHIKLSSTKLLKIGRCFFCYRVALSSDEFHEKLDQVITVKKSGKSIWGYGLAVLKTRNPVLSDTLFCSKDVFDETDTESANTNKEDDCCSTRDLQPGGKIDETGESVVFETGDTRDAAIVGGAVIVITLVVVAACANANDCKRRPVTSPEGPRNAVETISMENMNSALPNPAMNPSDEQA